MSRRPPVRACLAVPNPPGEELRRLLQAPRHVGSPTEHLGLEFRAFLSSRHRPYLAYARTRTVSTHLPGQWVQTAFAELAGLWPEALRTDSPGALAWYVLGGVIASHHGQGGDLVWHVWQRRQTDVVLLHHHLGMSAQSAADLMGISSVDVAVLLTSAAREIRAVSTPQDSASGTHQRARLFSPPTRP
ncbi:hypothetical protein ACFYNY_23515 [Streptomyces sp. NPDC006530]|uniref:hypothetical protein n=1 Tax=Streptomyces sp. NPDC006530 TaxID=3364750 RepID=UPI00367596D7